MPGCKTPTINFRYRLQLGELLGEGAFGRVVKGVCSGIPGHPEPFTVAVKMLKGKMPLMYSIPFASSLACSSLVTGRGGRIGRALVLGAGDRGLKLRLSQTDDL